jgi:hypothetical protein
MPNENNLVPFKPGHDDRRNKAGRPKKLITLLRESGYNNQDYKEVFTISDFKPKRIYTTFWTTIQNPRFLN